MNIMLKKFVDQEFLSQAQAEYIEEAVKNKESILISGHRSAGIRPFMAATMATAKSYHPSVQVKGFEDLEKDCDFLLIPGLDGIDFEKLIFEAIKQPNKSFVTVKEPEHPYSLMKLMRDAFKENQDTSKVYHMVECKKIDNVPKLVKITEMKLNEKGKMIKTDFEG